VTPESLAAAVRGLLPGAVAALGGDPAAAEVEVRVERPRQRDHGDYATNVALQVAKRAGVAPRSLAEAVAAALRGTSGVADAQPAGPGFVNITVDAASQGVLARDIVLAGARYGCSAGQSGQRVNLEFVSANPTGPVHIGGVRWAAVGDALGRILAAAGAEVTREYYFNDAGAQIERFALSVLAAVRGAEPPEDGYVGAYVTDIAREVVRRRPDVLTSPDTEAQEICRTEGVALMIDEIRASLEDLGVHFDVWFNEKSLHDAGELDLALRRLTELGRTYQADGATWLRTSDFGDDRDRVLLRRTGEWTYFAADCAYYLDKRERGFDRCLYLLGADHHGYVGRLRAVAACFGDDPDRTIEVLIGQFVNLVRDGQPVRMSKRSGTVLVMSDLVDAVGVDAARYALARYSTDSPIDLDLDLWARRTEDNPVFYVQYAHARLSKILRDAPALGLERGAPDAFPGDLLSHDREGDLLRALAEFPRVVATAAELREPHRVARHLEELAGTFHRFYDVCRVLPRGDEEPTDLHRARLWLVEATRVVLANGLGLLGVSAPEQM
jgi:arginyl-tRNA synthetase